MALIRTLILDDEPHWQLVLKRMADAHPSLQVIGVYGSPSEALPAITFERPDLLLLDVEFAEINGITFAKELEDAPLIIFVTTHERFALKSYEVSAVDYLVKPVMVDRFQLAIEKVQKQIELLNRLNDELAIEPIKDIESPEFFFIKDQSGYVKIRTHEILFVKSLENYIQIITSTGTFTTLATLNYVEGRLGNLFMRVHRSYLVNLDKVDVLSQDIIHVGSYEIPLGGQYLEQFKQAFITQNLLKR